MKALFPENIDGGLDQGISQVPMMVGFGFFRARNLLHFLRSYLAPGCQKATQNQDFYVDIVNTRDLNVVSVYMEENMNAQVLFSAANYLAMFGWLLLIIQYVGKTKLEFLKKPVFGAWIPVVLSVLYAVVMGLTLAGVLPGSEGSFASIDGVRSLFESDFALLAGWVHYLAFDLFVGTIIARSAQEHGLSVFILLPIWFFTFMFGPLGYLLWRIMRPFLIKNGEEMSA